MSVLCFPFSENDYFPQYECDDAVHLTHTQPNIDILSCDLYVTRFGCKSQCPGEQTFFVVTKSNISLLEERMAQTAECHLPNISLTSPISLTVDNEKVCVHPVVAALRSWPVTEWPPPTRGRSQLEDGPGHIDQPWDKDGCVCVIMHSIKIVFNMQY